MHDGYRAVAAISGMILRRATLHIILCNCVDVLLHVYVCVRVCVHTWILILSEYPKSK